MIVFKKVKKDEIQELKNKLKEVYDDIHNLNSYLNEYEDYVDKNFMECIKAFNEHTHYKYDYNHHTTPSETIIHFKDK